MSKKATVELFRDGTEMIIRSTVVLEELTPTRNRKTVVTIAGEDFFVADRMAGSDGSFFLYKLRPWRAGYEIPGRQLYYGSADDFATEAESRIREREQKASLPLGYILAFPFIGFLPRATKESLEERYGCAIQRHTFVSMCIEFAIGFGAMVLFTIFNIAGLMLSVMYGPGAYESSRFLNLGTLLIIVAICTIDLIFRSHHYLEERYLGFFEWLVRRRER